MNKSVNNMLVRLQSNSWQSNFNLDEILRPFGCPYFPEETTDKRIVLSTLSSSILVFFNILLLVGAIILSVLFFFSHKIMALPIIILFLVLAFFPYQKAETIIISSTGISLMNRLFVFKRTKVISRNEIFKLIVEQKTRGLFYIAVITLLRTNSKTTKIFSIVRKNHREIIEDSQLVVSSINKILCI